MIKFPVQSLLLGLAAATLSSVTAESSSAASTTPQHYPPSRNNYQNHLRKKPSTRRRYLTCDDACGKHDDNNTIGIPRGIDVQHIHLCRYNGHYFETVCVPARSSIVEQEDVRDTCGSCPFSPSPAFALATKKNQQKSTAAKTTTKGFESTEELRVAVDLYLLEEEEDAQQRHARLAATYGYPMGAWDVSQISDFSHLLAQRTRFDEDLGDWNMQSATDLSFMFWQARAFTGTNLGRWNVSRVQTLEQTFFGTESLTADLSTWRPTTALTNLQGTFWQSPHFSANLSAWNTGGVTSMARCFSDALAFDDDLSAWDIRAVTDMSYMFWQAVSLKHVPLSWNTSHVRTRHQMFAKVPYCQSPEVQQQIMKAWSYYDPAPPPDEDMFTAPRIIQSLRNQPLDAIRMDVSAMIQWQQNHTRHDDLVGDEKIRHNEARRQELSDEIRCHGGVCV